MVTAALATACSRTPPQRPAPAASDSTDSDWNGPPPRIQLQSQHGAAVTALSFSPDGRYLASGGADGAVRIWDIERRALVRQAHGDGLQAAGFLGWSPDGKQVAVTTPYWGSAVLDVSSGRFSRERIGIIAAVDGDGSARWITADTTDPVRVVDASFETLATLEQPPDYGAMDIAISPNGELFASVGSHGIAVWSIRGADPVPRVYALPDIPAWVEIHGDGARALVATVKAGTEEVSWSWVALADGTQQAAPIPAGNFVSAALSRDGAHLARIAMDSPQAWEPTLIYYDTDTGAPLWTWQWPMTTPVRGLNTYARPDNMIVQAISPDARWLAVGTDKGGIAVLETTAGRVHGLLGEAVAGATQLSFDGDRLLAWSNSHVTAWSLDTVEPEQQLRLPDTIDAYFTQDGAVGVARLNLGWTAGECQANLPALLIGEWNPVTEGWSPRPLDSAERGLFISPLPSVTANTQPIYHHDNERKVCFDLAGSITPYYALSPDFQWALVDLADRGPSKYRIAEVDTGRMVDLEGADQMTLYAYGPHAQFSPDSLQLASVAAGDVHVWDTQTGKHIAHIATGNTGEQAVVYSAFRADGGAIAAGHNNVLRIAELPSGSITHSIELDAWLWSIAWSGDDVLVGLSDGSIRRFRDGEPIARGDSEGGTIVAIAASNDGARLATSSNDGGVRIWDGPSMRVLATLVEFDADAWIAAAPDGSYTGTWEGADRLSWIFDQPMEPFRFEQFAEYSYDPMAVRSWVDGTTDTPRKRVARPPRIAIENIAHDTGEARADIEVSLERANSGTIIRAFREGRPIRESEATAAATSLTLSVPLRPGNNHISIIAFGSRGLASNSAVVELDGGPASAADRPDLWLIGVGVSDYPGLPPEAQLAVADDDARAMVDVWSEHVGNKRSYHELHNVLLTNGDVTSASVTSALSRLANMGSDDLAVVLLAGHGVKDGDDNMVFVTQQGRADSLTEGAISWDDIAAQLARAPGRVLVLLDACHAGHMTRQFSVPSAALAQSLASRQSAGAIVFAAARGTQLSYEQGSHGLFTAAVLKALSDPSVDRDLDGAIELDELVDAVTRRVSAETQGLQVPWLVRRELFGDFKLVDAPAR